MKFWQVTTKCYDTGKVTAEITDKVEAEHIPEGTVRTTGLCDIYTDWFDSYSEARAFVREAKEA